ncbi:MAG: RodZ domain-containing protein [Gemmatimonadales bacterium]
MSTLQILLLVVLVLASASTAGLAWALHRNTTLRRQHARALHLLSHDPLTGLWTRAVLLTDLARLHSAGRPILLAIVNVDQFAQINRLCGYRGGDQLLTLLAGVTQHRASLHRGAASRLGRDEMAVLWPDQTAADSDALTAALLAALGYAGWWLYSTGWFKPKPASQEARPAKAGAGLPGPTSAQAASSPAKPPGTAQPVADKAAAVAEDFTVHFRARGECWAEITADGQREEVTLRAGGEKQVRAREKVEVKLGDVSAVEISFNGDTLPPLTGGPRVRKLTFTREGLQR